MIKKITIKNFKKFADAAYEVNPAVSLFVGPNNGGKTTALQAIALWGSLIQEWNEKKGRASKSTAKKRYGAQVTRNAIYAVPVQEMKLLWFNTLTQTGKQQPIKIQIIADGIDKSGKEWEYGIELNYGGQEVLYCKPTDLTKDIPEDVYKIFHLPPLSGVQTQELKVELGAQRHSIGEGRPGEILRNLLLQVQEKGKWDDLCAQIKNMFNVQLEKTSFNPSTDAYILVRYREVWPRNKGCLLEIANGGSGFLQFLLLAAFLYVHDNSILLIDEPDSHMHVRLQQGMYVWLQQIAAKNNVQLLISTHSEVIINNTDTDYIYTFFGKDPKSFKGDKKQVIKALEEISTIEILNAQEKKFVLFAEGDTDFPLLKSWATNLKPDISKELNDVFRISTQNNQIDVAKRKFCSLKIVEPSLKGFFIRDNVSKTESKDIPPGLDVCYWPRQEIENYLIIPSVLERFVSKQESPGELFTQERTERAKQYLKDNLPPKVYNDPLNNDYPGKGSDFLDEFFREVDFKINKRDYWQIADMMDKSEIHQDIKKMLTDLQKVIE
ncbi:MAG: AAA family ATPase [Phycisphaerae bacterium]|nr:AAA family ATPase [Phycisphaerae bacterium]